MGGFVVRAKKRSYDAARGCRARRRRADSGIATASGCNAAMRREPFDGRLNECAALPGFAGHVEFGAVAGGQQGRLRGHCAPLEATAEAV